MAKTGVNRSDVQNLSARGASAWEADANATAYLVKEGEGQDATRWLVLGKRRFEPRWEELQLESHQAEVEGIDAWGDPEPLTLRWAIAEPTEGGRQEQAAKAQEAQALQDDADLRQSIRDVVQIAWQEKHPLNRAGVKARIKRKTAEVVACIDVLLSEGWLMEVHVPKEQRTNSNRRDFLVNLDTPEREAMRRGEPAPAEKIIIPESWKHQIPSVPKNSENATENVAEKNPIPSVPKPSVPLKEKKDGNERTGLELPPSCSVHSLTAGTDGNGRERTGTDGITKGLKEVL